MARITMETLGQAFYDEDEVTVYKVYALGKGSFIEEEVLLNKMTFKVGSPFIAKKATYPADNSLSDMGIIENHYNQHRCFFELEEAKEYLEEALTKSRRAEWDDWPDQDWMY